MGGRAETSGLSRGLVKPPLEAHQRCLFQGPSGGDSQDLLSPQKESLPSGSTHQEDALHRPGHHRRPGHHPGPACGALSPAASPLPHSAVSGM